MKQLIGMIILFALIRIDGVQLPFLRDVILTANNSRSLGFILTNQRCEQCLCLALHNSSLLALNCFSNLTCQFFFRYPRVYQFQPMNNSRLYFVQKKYPNASNPCCVSNTTFLLDRLRLAISIGSVVRSVPRPRCLMLDSDDLLATVEEGDSITSAFDEFDPVTLSLRSRQLLGAKPTNMAYRDRKFYIGWDSNHTISILTKPNTNGSLIYLTNIGSSANMDGVRDIMFLNNGQTMVVVSVNNKRLVFFSSTNNTDYVMTSNIVVNYDQPHGMHRVNDSFFYVLSWNNPSVYAYSYNQTTSNWRQTLFVNATIDGNSYGSHITIDNCNRRWLTILNYGTRIYDEKGIHLGDWLLESGYFDTVLLDNYTVIMTNLDRSKITRVDPRLQCDED